MSRDIDDLRHPERCPTCGSDDPKVRRHRHYYHNQQWGRWHGADHPIDVAYSDHAKDCLHSQDCPDPFHDDLMAEGYREAAATNGFQDECIDAGCSSSNNQSHHPSCPAVTFDSHNLSASDGLRTRDETPATALPAEVEEAIACTPAHTIYYPDGLPGKSILPRDTLRSHIGWQNATIVSLQALSEWTAEKQERLDSLTEEVERLRVTEKAWEWLGRRRCECRDCGHYRATGVCKGCNTDSLTAWLAASLEAVKDPS